MKPSWFSGLGPDIYNPALETLDYLFGVEDLQFQVGPGSATVHWVDPAKILNANLVTRGEVTDVQPGRIVVRDGTVIEAKNIVVAAGVWTSALTNFYVEGRAGAAFLWKGKSVERPFISPWAPYRQIVAFNRGDGLWVGDGTAVKTWNPERESVSRLRCAKAIGDDLAYKPETLYGQRPYVTGVKHAAIKQLAPGLWVATGGAKNGTLGAGYAGWYLNQKLS